MAKKTSSAKSKATDRKSGAGSGKGGAPRRSAHRKAGGTRAAGSRSSTEGPAKRAQKGKGTSRGAGGKGPSVSATSVATGTKKKGNDGNTWVVIETKTGVRRWSRLRSKSSRQKGSVDRDPRERWTSLVVRQRGSSPGKPTSGSAGAARAGAHRLLFCEPYTLPASKPQSKGRRGRYAVLTVGDDLYAAVLRGAKNRVKRGKFDVGNAYVFGHLFPQDQYIQLGWHGNDGAQTGLIDLDLYDPRKQEGLGDIVLEAYKAKSYDWNDRRALQRVREKVPHVLFIGETIGGDVGASLYAHREPKTGEFDSLIIDNNYYF